MQFLVDPLDGAHNASAEEQATMSDLRIMVGQVNACSHWDDRIGAPFDSVRVPAVYLAEGIATDWWTIFGRRDGKHPIWPYRTGFILPCLSFSCDGSTFEVSAEQLYCDNPGLRFWPAGSEVISRPEAESILGEFVQSVAGRIEAYGIQGSEVALQWSRVSASRQDPDESAFCEAAGALGVNPYSIHEDDSQLIEKAGDLFEGDVVNDFLAGVTNLDRKRRGEILSVAFTFENETGDDSHLPGLREAASQISPESKRRFPGERAWAPGYRCAGAFRDTIGVRPEDGLTSVEAVAERLGSRSFKYADGLSGILAMVARHDDIYVHMRGTSYPGGPSENFNFARAIGDAVCFPDGRCSVINGLHGAERQAMSRAFAAEFLAPVERVLDMRDGGRTVDQIANIFAVSQEVIERQVENRSRISQACD